MQNIQVPALWFWASLIYFCISILWSCAMLIGALLIYRKVMPLVNETRIQVRRVSDQARSVALHAAHTAEVVHAQTQHLLGTASQAGAIATRPARTLGAAVTGMLAAARVVNFVRKVL